VTVEARRGGKANPSDVATFAVVPNAARPRFLVPLRSRRSASATLLSYNALRPTSTRMARWLLGAGFRVGLGPRILRDRLVVHPKGGVSSSSDGRDELTAHLGSILGRRDLVFAVGIGSAGPNRKPTLQVFSEAGEPVAFVKIGWSDLTRMLVRKEADALEAWRKAPHRHHVAVPTLLYRGVWQDLELSVTEPLPQGVRAYGPASRLPPLEATREVAALGGTERQPLSGGPFWAQLSQRVADALSSDPTVEAAPLEALLRSIDARHGNRDIELGSWHGDWAPWNLARGGERLYVLDWEHWRGGVPVGFDVLHYRFSVPFLLRRTNLPDATRSMLQESLPALAELGVPEDLAPALAGMYLIELFLRAHEAKQAGAGVNPRVLPDIPRAIAAARSWLK
jgi:hypothetical protein